MNIIGLSGSSGTGKSYHAQDLCLKLNIDAIIDDGLFIFHNNLAAGRSAKRQPTKIGAVKTAVFANEDHRHEVVSAIEKYDPSSILILGTSDKMITSIAKRLGLPQPERFIHIEDIASESEIEQAQIYRYDKGMHVIPAPTLQVQPQFSGFFIDAKRGFKNKRRGINTARTIVRPSYSYLGGYHIADKAINDIVLQLVKNNDAFAGVVWTTEQNSDEGMYIRTIVKCRAGRQLRDASIILQKQITESVSAMTSFHILGVDVELRELKSKK